MLTLFVVLAVGYLTLVLFGGIGYHPIRVRAKQNAIRNDTSKGVQLLAVDCNSQQDEPGTRLSKQRQTDNPAALLRCLLELIVKQDVNTDYSKPAVGALLRLSNPQNATSQCVAGKNALTCTLTLN